jgi:serine/threonine protein kinase
VLVLQSAGDETLAGLLRKEGVPSLDLLGRYGDDLLAAVGSLERHGITHRDIKPDNIGIRTLTKQRNQLILFDFSLSGAPLDNIRVGTPGYIDPFLPNRKPMRWDLSAERYSAAVTLYEMAAGFGAPARPTSLRPEAVRIVDEDARVRGQVQALRYLGSGTRVVVAVPGGELSVFVTKGLPVPAQGAEVGLGWDAQAMHPMEQG